MPPWCRPRPRHIERPQPAGFWYNTGASQSMTILNQKTWFSKPWLFFAWFPHAFLTFSKQDVPGQQNTIQHINFEADGGILRHHGLGLFLRLSCWWFWDRTCPKSDDCALVEPFRKKRRTSWLTLAESWRVSASFFDFYIAAGNSNCQPIFDVHRQRCLCCFGCHFGPGGQSALLLFLLATEQK